MKKISKYEMVEQMFKATFPNEHAFGCILVKIEHRYNYNQLTSIYEEWQKGKDVTNELKH